MTKAFNNWKVVLLSLIGATTFWFFNALNKDYNARINYPVEFEFDRDSVVVVKPLTSTVVIDVSSGGWNLLRKTFWFNVTPVVIPLDNPTEIGFYTRASLLPMIEDQLSELTINYLVTDTVFIHIEPKVSKKVTLSLDSLALPLEVNHRVTSPIRITPDTVMLTGPRSFLDTIGHYYQLSLGINGISNTFSRMVDVSLPTRRASSKPDEVRVTFEVEKFERFSIEVNVESVNFPEDSSVYLSHESVQIFYTVPESKKDNFAPKDFAVTADLTMLNPEDSTVLAILVYYPEQALDLEVIPEYIKVSSGN